MNEIAIKINSLSKSYRIGKKQERYTTFRDAVSDFFVAPFRKAGKLLRGQATGAAELDKVIWALKDVSMEVRQGEVLGIIGRNGAGKTTLLKVLSRITEPTEGYADIYGRVGALLEVGTGFHAELTGRENVFLNGAILGMKRDEINRKFDDIVEFAEIEQFIDTPVKHYSSGMYVRLAFAVAAHLNPDTLLIDEVLAVGDAGFQKKCIASINHSTGEGKTALIVSHNMGLVRSLCSRVLLLENGSISCEGSPDQVISAYHNTLLSTEIGYKADSERSNREIYFSEAYIRNRLGDAVSEIPCGEGLRIEMKLSSKSGNRIDRPWVGVLIYSSFGNLVSHLANREAGFELNPLGNESTVVCDIETLNLTPGEYYISFGISDINIKNIDKVEKALSFTITPADIFGSGMLPSQRDGQVIYHSHWWVENSKS
jgi:lipopolysaccharide transport system ATP-binding protein